MRCMIILKNFINRINESRTAWSVNRYTRNKYIFHTEPTTLFSNIYNTLDNVTFTGFCIKNIICPDVQKHQYLS